jgi:hypothetical protein
MEISTNKENTPKATERVNKFCNTLKGFSDKDIKAMSYIVEKSSRIASVTFLLADVLDKESPLHTELQKTAIGLIRDSAKSAKSIQSRESLVSHLLTLVALLDTSDRSGQLSHMNTETLSDEATALSEFINIIDWHSGRRFTEESLFGGEVPRDVFSPEPMATASNSYKSHQRDTLLPHQRQQQQSPDFYASQTQKQNEPKGRVQYKERVQEAQKDRRATILGLVQKKDRINVKDVSNIIKDCSEKTIQRELLALVKQGVLKKEGERRWSTYSMA